jgi:hypothetical protein
MEHVCRAAPPILGLDHLSRFTKAMRRLRRRLQRHMGMALTDLTAHQIICRSANKSCDKLNFCPPSSWEGGYFFDDYFFLYALSDLSQRLASLAATG